MLVTYSTDTVRIGLTSVGLSTFRQDRASFHSLLEDNGAM